LRNELATLNAGRFGLTSFADILPERQHIAGEDIGSYSCFHDAMLQALTPFTPYECVVAENIIAVEWELLQRRRMREAALRKSMRKSIKKALLDHFKVLHENDMDEKWKAFVAAGNDGDSWEDPYEFDEREAGAKADLLAMQVTSEDMTVQAVAAAEAEQRGVDLLDIMSAAYLETNSASEKHDDKAQKLERRGRELKKDYDLLQRARPIEAEAYDA
jgi:hypothetical protein